MVWFGNNYLLLTVAKTKEVVVGFRSSGVRLKVSPGWFILMTIELLDAD